MKTVLIICPFAFPNLGGVETHIDKLTKYLTKNNWRVILLTYQPLTTKARGAPYEKIGNLEIHRVSWFGYNWFPRLEPYPILEFLYLFPGLFFKSFFYYLQHHKEIDCIHAHGFVSAMIGKILTWVHPKRKVISTHAIYHLRKDNFEGKFTRWLLADYNQILAVGDPSKKELENLGFKNVKVHPNWIDLSTFKPIDRGKGKKLLNLNKFVVLFVGRFLEKKGIKFLLEAAKKLSSVQFVFIGDGPITEEVRQTSKEQKNVLYPGKLSQEDSEELKKLIRYYSAADLFASPVTYEEGFGAVYLETIACGTPILTSPKGCLPTFLNDSVAIFIQPSVENIVRAINNLIQNPEKLKRLQSNCRPYAEKYFSEENAKIIMDSYNREQKEKLKLILSKVGDLNFRRRIVTLLDFLEFKDTDKVLDAGCGEGFYLMILKELWPEIEIWAIDSDQEILEKGKKWLENYSGIHWQVGNINSLPYPDNFFDKIILSEVLEHLSDDKRALLELKRVLKPEGLIGITIPNHNYPFLWDPLNWVREHLGLGHFSEKSGFWGGIWALNHYRLYYPDEIKKLVKDCGFKIEKIKGLTHYGIPFNHLVLYLGKQFYTRLPVPETIRKSMEKFEWSSSLSGIKDYKFSSNLFGLALAILKWVDHFNDNFNNLEKSSMAIALLVKKTRI